MGKALKSSVLCLLGTFAVFAAFVQPGGQISARALPSKKHRDKETIRNIVVIPISSIDLVSSQVSNGGDVEFSVTFKTAIASTDSVKIQVSVAPLPGYNSPGPWPFTVNGSGSDTYHLAHQICVDGEFKLSADTVKLDNTLLGQPQTTGSTFWVAEN